jgi:hypothetical protein
MALHLALAIEEDAAKELPRSVAVDDVAATCRRAVHCFLDLAEGPVSRRDLVAWLTGPYRAATASSRAQVSRRSTYEGIAATRPASPVDENTLAEVIEDAARRARALIEHCRAHDVSSMAPDLVAGGIVERVCDAAGAIGYVPVSRAGMRLRDRLVALVMADVLSCPEWFGADDDATPASAVVAKRCDTVPWGLSD